jgi:hypothetical protein
MKKYTKHLVIIFSILIHINFTKAQENQVKLNNFMHEDSLKLQLQKHGLDLYAMPEFDPCFRLSKPPLLRDLPFEPSDSMHFDSATIDTTKLIIGSGGLGKSPGDVNIFWIHGLNGSTETWAVAAKATEYGVMKNNEVVFPARKANSYRGLPSSNSNPVQLYSEDLGILSASQDVEDYMDSEVPITDRTSKDFIIAHSQGGIVGREWLRQSVINPSTFKNLPHGLVTFGTPHDGAEILNNTRPDLRNKVPNFMNEACKSLVGAYVIPKINSNFGSKLLVSSNMQDKIVNLGCGLVSKSIIPFVLDNYHKRTTLDYYNGSKYLTGYNSTSGHVQGLSEYKLKVPVVQFYGIEKAPVLWKFMSSVLAMGHDKLDNKEIIFGYEKDNELELKVNDMINEFDALYNYEQNMADHYGKQELLFYTSSILLGLNSGLALLGYNATLNKNASIENYRSYGKAKVWLTNANDYYLTDIVGARVTNTTLNCRVVGNLDCRDNRYNPINSGVPPVNVNIDYNFNTTNSACNIQPVNVAYADYRFRGHNGSEWHGPCTGNLTVIPEFKITYWYKDNDGVVLAESAAKEINVEPNYSHKIVSLPETNHDQMKNSTITKLELINLYNGVHGSFFAIPVR